MKLWDILRGKYVLIHRDDWEKLLGESKINKGLWDNANLRTQNWIKRENIAYQKLTRCEVENARLRREIQSIKNIGGTF